MVLFFANHGTPSFYDSVFQVYFVAPWHAASSSHAADRQAYAYQCCQVPVFVRIFTEIRLVIRSTEMQWSIPQI